MVRWLRRAIDSPGITQVPAGPYAHKLARRSIASIQITRPRYDNIGAVLTAMGVSWEPFAGEYDSDLLFVNCGTPDHLDPDSLRRFVERGGCLYASDLTSALLTTAFPGIFDFAGGGTTGTIPAVVVDSELQHIVGRTTSIHFDMGGWSVLSSCRGAPLVEAGPGTEHAGSPLMVGVEVGHGVVFYTSFHNRAQASEQETVLLQLLVLKQIGAKSNLTLDQAGKSVGVSLTGLAAHLVPDSGSR